MELRPEIISEKLRIGRMRWGVRQVLAVPRGRLFSRSGAFSKPLCYGTADLPQTLKCFSRFSYFSEMKRSRSIRKCEINIYKLIGQSAWRRCSRSGSKRRSALELDLCRKTGNIFHRSSTERVGILAYGQMQFPANFVADCDQGSWNPDLFEFLGFRVRLHLPGMTPEGLLSPLLL